MNNILEQLQLFGVVPVLVVDDEKYAAELGKALTEGGLPCGEVTFRTNSAPSVIARMVKSCPEMLIGAGTVLTVDQIKMAVDSGARFIVSPGINRKVVEYCVSHSIPVIPGVLTPTEIEVALDLGLEAVKFFPAEASGGLNYLKAVSAPYRTIKFIPTGGIDDKNLLPYLKYPAVIACGGSWLAGRELINQQEFGRIRDLVSQVLNQILGFEIRHIGVNMPDPKSAQELTLRMSDLFRMPVKDGNSSMFVGTEFEILKKPYLGTHGHIALCTNFIDRSIAYFERVGIKILEDTRNVKDGKLSTVYLDIDLGGFAVHLVQM